MKMIFATFILSLNALSWGSEPNLGTTLDHLSKHIPPENSSVYSELPFASWIDLIDNDPRIGIELKEYISNNETLPDAYVESFTASVKNKLFSAQQDWIKNANCTSYVKGEFINKGKSAKNNNYSSRESETIQSFESSLIRIESTGCLTSNSSLEVFNEYIKPSFQLAAISTLKSSNIVNNMICEKTEVFALGSSQYCYNVQINYEASTDTLSLHTYNLTNAPISEASAPVYFREIVFTFKKVAPNKIAAMLEDLTFLV
jgi:hypothetical protein